MKYDELRPIRDWHTNHLLIGGDEDLPATRLSFDSREGVLSVWKASLWARIKFLFHGKVNFVCKGPTHPPISIVLGDYIDAFLNKRKGMPPKI